MKPRRILFIIVALLFIGVFAPLQIVNAEPIASLNVTNYNLGCGTISVTGTSDAPYVYVNAVNVEFSVPFTTLVPVINGQFSFSQSFAETPAGTFTVLVLAPADGSDLQNIAIIGEAWIAIDFCRPTEYGPDIPAAFEMRTIICDTPIYDNPAGSLVGSAAVTTGQTFYANPVDAVAADGSHWTQIFDGAWTYPYIPSVCVQ